MAPALERLQPRELRLLLGGVLLVAAALFGSLLWPQAKAVLRLQHSLATLRAAGADRAELSRRQTTLRDEVSRMRQRFQGSLAGLSQEQAEARAVGLLQQLCWQHHLELVSVSPRLGERVQNFTEIAFDIETRGRYADLYAWLDALHSTMGSLTIRSFEIQPTNASVADSPLAMKVEVVAYRSIEP